MSIRNRILLSLLFIGTSPLYALDPNRLVSQYGMRQWADGLPQVSAHAIVQDRQGYIWIGTEEGLARFDGVRFSIFDGRNTPALTIPWINSIVMDAAGDLWMGTGGGLVRRSGDRFILYTTRDGLPSNKVSAIAVATDGAVWIGTTDNGLSRFGNGRFRNFGVREGLPDPTIIAIERGRDGTMWVATQHGLVRVHNNAIEAVPLPDAVQASSTRALHQDRAGDLWIATSAGLFRLHNSTIKSITEPQLAHAIVTTMRSDSAGNLWIGTLNAGLYRMHGADVQHLGEHEGFQDHWIFAIYEDRERNLWVGTCLAGVVQLRDTLLIHYGTRQGVPADDVAAISDVAGSIVIGTANGVARLDGLSFRPVPTDLPLSGVPVLGVAADRSGTVWMATLGKGLARIRGGHLDMLTTRDGLPTNVLLGLRLDSEGSLWITTTEGLVRRRNGRFETLGSEMADPRQVLGAVAQAPDGSLYFGAQQGGVLHYRNGHFTTARLPKQFSGEMTMAILADVDGTLWVTTINQGLIRIRNGRAAQVTSAQGLPAGLIQTVIDDHNDHIWMTSNHGVFGFSRRELNAAADDRAARVNPIFLNLAEVVRAAECSYIRSGGVRANDGTIWISVTKGVVRFNPRDAVRPTMVPPTVVESATVDGVRVFGDSLVVPAGAERLELAYTAFHFAAPDAVTFRYQLEGFDGGWIDAGTRRTASYSKLPPGKYRFRVQATARGGVWSGETSDLAIVQQPKFYQTTWFAVLAALVIAAALWFTYAFRVRALRRRAKELARLVRVATQKNQVILDSAADGILGVDPGNTITFINQAGAGMLGWEPEAVVGQLLHPLLHPDEAPTDCAICHPPSSESRSAAPVLFLARDGRTIPVDVTVSAMPNRGGAVITFRDVTERVAIEQMKTEFLATVSHELRTPLTAIRGALGLLCGPRAESIAAKTPHLLQMAVRNCDRLLRLVNELLDSERLVSGRIELQRDGVDASTLMQQTAELMQPVAEQSSVTVVTEPLAVAIYVDGDRIVQLLTNLIGNAVKFSPAGGVVRLTAEVADDAVLFHVHDQGRGIPPEKLEAVFERFRQVESSDAHEKGGSGLGLAICRGIAEAHGGRIWVESQPGVGSTFSVSLPLALNRACLAVAS